LYDCKDGKCIQTQGYVKNSVTVYAYVDQRFGQNTEKPNNKGNFYSNSAISDCTGGNFNGYILNNKSGICINGNVVLFISPGRYLINYVQGDHPTTTPFYVGNENVPVKVVNVNNNVQYIVVDKFNSGEYFLK